MWTFLKNNRKDNPEKEGEVKSDNPFATTINWVFHHRESMPIPLVQLRLLQGNQRKKHPNWSEPKSKDTKKKSIS